MGVIYKITNRVNGKCYIGQAQDPSTRFKNHRANPFCKNEKNRTNIPKLYNAMRKYGLENFEFKILVKVENFELDRLEKAIILRYDSVKNGYNITFGGNTPLGIKRSEETKKKISDAKKGKPFNKSPASIASNMRRIGTHQTQETKDKISAKLSNRLLRQETKDKLSDSKIKYTYHLKDPSEIIHITNNITHFSKEFGLIRSSMNKVCNGKQHHHKGWTCVERVKLEK